MIEHSWRRLRDRRSLGKHTSIFCSLIKYTACYVTIEEPGRGFVTRGVGEIIGAGRNVDRGYFMLILKLVHGCLHIRKLSFISRMILFTLKYR